VEAVPPQRVLCLSVEPDTKNALHSGGFFSMECLRQCFAQKGWDSTCTLSLSHCQPSQSEWMALAELSFECIEFYEVTVQREFLQLTRCKRIDMRYSQLEHSPLAFIPITTPLCLHQDTGDSVDTLEALDDYVNQWMKISKTVSIHQLAFTEETWIAFWQRVQHNTTCISLTIVGGTIGGYYLSPKHLDAVSKHSWMIEWFSDEEDGNQVHARRILPALTDTAMTYFRPQQNPLLGDEPPFDARQSVILEALLRSRNDQSRLFNLSRTYSQVLLMPRSDEDRAHDVETSIVELRALGVDHQAIIEMLVQANNSLQQRRASDGQQLNQVIRRLDEVERQRNQDIRRMESRLQALENENRILRAQVFQQDEEDYASSSSNGTEDLNR
jgi:hypothetical protein